jgi:drug/metabolite transporter (DMT)-like permease
LSRALAGLATLPFGWITPSIGETVALISIGVLGGASASPVAPFDYTAMIWALVLGYAMFGETPTSEIVLGSAIIAAAGLFVIWRERQLAAMRRRDGPAPARAATTLRTP